MKLDTLIDGLAVRTAGPDVEVLDLSSDSRELGPGWAFLALKGERADGAAFIPQALARGACAVLAEAFRERPAGVAACVWR